MSAEIRGIFTDALDQLGIGWRQNRFNSISVARREAVAALDAFVGPKSFPPFAQPISELAAVGLEVIGLALPRKAHPERSAGI
jgi:hypothetical protein